MRLELDQPKLDFDDVMLVPSYSDITSRKNVVLTREIRGRWGQTLTGVPIIAANMHGVGTFKMAQALSAFGMFTAINKDTSVKSWFEFFEDPITRYGVSIISPPSSDSVFLTLGMDVKGENTNRDKLRMLVAAKCFKQMKIVVDVANGYMNPFYDYLKQVRDIAPEAFILAGTVCTPEAAERLVESGADLARVGIGSGAVCVTRTVAGVGYPQASAIMECSQVADVVCDGGCTTPGDFAKAFALGSSMVMAGTVFAAHEEGGVEPDEHGFVRFYGMSSHEAQDTPKHYRSSEGRVVKLPHRGKVGNTVTHILGGLRSACTYSNAETLEELHENARVIRVNNQLNRSVEKYTI